MDDQAIDLRDIWVIFVRNCWIIILMTCICVLLAFLATTVLPKKYKAKGVIAIQASYFQNPMVNNLITDVIDPNELRGQRQALLQQALTVSFIDKLGEKFGEFKEGASRSEHAIERELLNKRILVEDMGANAFKVTVTAKDAQKSLDMVKMVIAQMEKTVIEQRNETLLSTRKAIEQHVNKLSGVLVDSGENLPQQNANKVRQELAKVENELSMLMQHFTASHPQVMKLRAKANLLKNHYAKMPQENKIVPSDALKIFSTSSAQEPVREVYNELLKNLINIDIVLDREKNRDQVSYFSITEYPTLPTGAYFPNVLIFLVGGLLVGVTFALVIIVFREFKRGTFVSPSYVAEQLNMPLLGEMPYSKDLSQEVLLLDNVEARRTQKLLPQE